MEKKPKEMSVELDSSRSGHYEGWRTLGFRKAREIMTDRAGLGTKVEKKHGDQDGTRTRRCIV